MRKQRVLIVDFDGTYIRGNSFRMWVYHILKKTLILRFDIFLKVFFATFRRKVMKSLSHVEYKELIDSLAYPTCIIDDFFCLISEDVSSSVYKEIEKAKESGFFSTIILSTAAPSCYIEHFFNKDYFPLFSSVMCSAKIGDEFFDNYKENKYLNFREKYAACKFELFTDHEDDLYLAKHAERVYLCNASYATKEAFFSKGISFGEIVDENS